MIMAIFPTGNAGLSSRLAARQLCPTTTHPCLQNSIPFFSNPLVSYLGVSTGNENSEDNALALNLSAPYASNFRNSVVQAILQVFFH